MPDFPSVVLEVSASEDGMKLLRFLERRLADHAPGTALHKWIRTGQVRVNSGRAKPFSRLAAGDRVRIPPFAQARTLNLPGNSPADGTDDQASASAFPADAPAGPGIPPDALPDLGPDVPVIARTTHLLVLAKPAGLACQPGSGQEDDLCARLDSAFAGSPFIPAPAHRIDRHTSGLVIAGLSHAAQQRLHALFASGGIHKEYLAWVWGDWACPGPCLLEDRLVKQATADRESMIALPGGRLLPLPFSAEAPASEAAFQGRDAGRGFAASAAVAVQRLSQRELSRTLDYGRHSHTQPDKDGFPRATLLLLRLFTGRTHQLRVQLASRGFPIIGDGRYSGPRFPHMLLHAFALSLPKDSLLLADEELDTPRAAQAAPLEERLEFSFLPSWPARFSPDPALLDEARLRLNEAVKNSDLM